MTIAVLTTFPTNAFKVYAEAMLQSYVAYWPEDVGLLVKLDDDLLLPDVQRILRDVDGVVAGHTEEQAKFLERNKGRDDPNDYRKQACRFSHKIFALKSASDFWLEEKKRTGKTECRYLIWMDADVLTTRKVTHEDLQKCLPKEGDAVAYLGRKDWDHSECGWLAFDLENGGASIIDVMYTQYTSDMVFKMPQWHDSYVFDFCVTVDRQYQATNLTPDAKGIEVWPQSPMAPWSKHYKGPIAKSELSGIKPEKHMKQVPLRVETTNSLPNPQILQNILENQTQITEWLQPCLMNEEEIVVVSAGPTLIPEDVRKEIAAGRKIVAVKHALKPLKDAGITPWACILLDPREHVYDFVEHPDKDILWLVASQVTPKAVKSLLTAGCRVLGYHAAVGAGEDRYTDAQSYSIVTGGSATATRGLYVLEKLGFHRFILYGYDLCLDIKPDLSEKDDKGQPKHFEINLDIKMPSHKVTRSFWSKGELIAQSNELKHMLDNKGWEVKAFGYGMGPFIVDAKRLSDLREAEKKYKLGLQNPVSYQKFLGCRNKTLLSALSRRMRQLLRRNPTKAVSF